MCVCVCTFTSAKPNKHHPSASQGERTQVSVRVQLSRGWPRDCLTSACVCVSMPETLSGEWETSVWPQFTALFIVPVSILFFIKTTYSELVIRSWITVEAISMISSNITDYWTVSDAIQWHESKTEAKLETTLRLLMREIWKPDTFPRKTSHWQNRQAP